MKIEVCVDQVEGVRVAAAQGAQRVELCANLLEGGTTPSLGLIRRARAVPDIALHVMIRPRGGDFLYDDDEFEAMQTDIAAAKAEGADGVVFGVLDADGAIDHDRMYSLIADARPMAVTCHRAFDMTRDPAAALEALVALRVERVLTSGQEATALEGLPLIAALVRQAGGRISVMPGGGITPRNISRIAHGSRAQEIHVAALVPSDSAMRFRRESVFMGGELRAPEYARPLTSDTLLRAVMAAAAGPS
jgi:copper homeostasis protein